MRLEWPVWRLVTDRIETLASADQYELLDLIKANEALDAKQEAEREANKR
jgi:hypothetical protein